MSLAACGSGGGEEPPGDEPPVGEAPERLGEACEGSTDCGVGLRCAPTASGPKACQLDGESSIGPIETAAFSSPQGACGANTGEMALRFVLTDMNQWPLTQGDWVGGEPIELPPENVSVDLGAVFESSDTACESDAACSDGFSCGFAPAYDHLEEAALKRCYRDATLSTGTQPDSLRALAQPSGAQVFGVLVENSHSLDGFHLSETTGAYDADGDGTTDVGPPDPRNAAVGSDPDGERFAAVAQTELQWQSVARWAELDEQRSFFGLWSFDASDISPTAHVQPGWAVFGSGLPAQAVDDLSQASAGRERANVYEAAVGLLQDNFSDSALSQAGVVEPTNAQKTLVLLVDGPDEMRESDATGIDDVIAAATAAEVRVFVVHFDPALDEPGSVRDAPSYYRDQEPCTSDDECKNYETCRTPRGYASAVGEPSDAPSETYCMLNRSEKGRVGPVADFERLACATGGAYFYRTTEAHLTKELAPLPRTQRSWWQADVDLAEVSSGEVDAGEYRLGGQLNVEWDGFTQGYGFSIAGGLPPRDQRGVVWVP